MNLLGWISVPYKSSPIPVLDDSGWNSSLTYVGNISNYIINNGSVNAPKYHIFGDSQIISGIPNGYSFGNNTTGASIVADNELFNVPGTRLTTKIGDVYCVLGGPFYRFTNDGSWGSFLGDFALHTYGVGHNGVLYNLFGGYSNNDQYQSALTAAQTGEVYIFVYNDKVKMCVLFNKNNSGGYSIGYDWFCYHEDGSYISVDDLTIFQNYDDALNVSSSPYNPGGTSGPAGGGGTFGKDEVSDDVSGQLPTGTSEGDTSDCGVFTRYLVDNSELFIIGKYLWNPGILQIIDQAVLSLFMPSIMDGVISLVSYPFDINSIPNLRFSTGRTPTIANFAFITNTSVAYQFEVLESSGAQFDWGTIDIPNFYGAFLDYEPYTKIELYLPWGTGFVPIDPNECTPGTLNVKTNFEFDKGTCVHTVTATNSRTGTTTVIGCYSGLCGKQIPISSLDYASKATAIVSLGVSAAVGAIAGPGTARAIAAESAGDKAIVSAYQSGGLMFSDEARAVKTEAMNKTIAKYESVTKKAAKMATNSAIQAAHSKVNINRNGSFTNGSNGLGIQHPYIIISRPNQSVPVEYGHFYGYPSNIYESLRNLSGYTEVGEIHLKGIACTSNEYSEIESLLKDGVVF